MAKHTLEEMKAYQLGVENGILLGRSIELDFIIGMLGELLTELEAEKLEAMKDFNGED